MATKTHKRDKRKRRLKRTRYHQRLEQNSLRVLSRNTMSLTVTWDPIEDGKSSLPEIRDQIQTLNGQLLDDPQSAVESIEALYAQYPNVPVVGNYLAAAYKTLGRKDEWVEVAKRQYGQHPDYLFAKVHYALHCIDSGELERVDEIFGGCVDLPCLYPDRDVFHITEVRSFYFAIGIYGVKTGNMALSEFCTELITELDPEAPEVEVLDGHLFQKGILSRLGRLLG